MDKQKAKELLSEIQKIKTFSKIKSTKDFDSVVDIISAVIDRLKELGLTQTEISKQILDYVKKENLEEIISEITDKVKGLIRMPEDGEKGDKGDVGETGKSGKDGRDGKDGKDGKTITNQIIETIIEKTPIITNEIREVAVADTPEVIREKLESLEDDERLPIKAIKDLQEELDKLKKHIDSKVVYVGGGGVGKHNVVAHDLSDSLSADGSVRSFNLPAFWKIVSVNLSSFPNILRPNIDFTVSGSQIILTSEVPDASIMKGQTLIVLFSE